MEPWPPELDRAAGFKTDEEFAMNDATNVVARYIEIWNETDAAARQALIAQAWTADGTYLDPIMRSEGAAAIDAMIAGAQAQFPGFRFRRTGKVDAHNGHMRFSWECGPGETGAAVIAGTDFAELAADGRLAAVTGFLDLAPGMEG
jgi:hypothetical protein